MVLTAIGYKGKQSSMVPATCDRSQHPTVRKIDQDMDDRPSRIGPSDNVSISDVSISDVSISDR
jgi:hypothetical protein